MGTLSMVEFIRKIRWHQAGGAGADHGKFDGAFQLSNIAGPGVGHEQMETVWMQIGDSFACGGTDLGEQGLCEQWNVISSISKRRQMDARHADAIE